MFLDNLACGIQFEHQFGQYLITNHFHVLNINTLEKPLYQPDLILPDLLVSKAGNTFWVECKKKERLKFWAKTGCETRLYHHYTRVERVSGLNILLVFKDKDNLYGNWLTNLQPFHWKHLTLFALEQMLAFDMQAPFHPPALTPSGPPEQDV